MSSIQNQVRAMDPNILAVINGTLTSPDIDTTNLATVTAQSQLFMDISGYTVMSNGFVVHNGFLIPASTSGEVSWSVPDKSWLVWRETISGALVSVVYIDSAAGKTNADVMYDALQRVGEVGPPPKANADIMLPASSMRVAVGCGQVNGGYLVRYQYWGATDSSYCLPDGDTRNISVTTSHGVQQTSSTEQTVATSISSSASAGWGPVSATLSYSMDTSSTSSNSYEITDESTRSDSVMLTNNGGSTVYYLAWQLMDVVQVYLTVNSQSAPSASIVTACSPIIYDGPYNPAALPPSPLPSARMTDEERKLVSSWNVQRPPLPQLHG